jgi:biotin/methionine sulfoxide reductase
MPKPTWLEPNEWLGATSAAIYPLHLILSQPRYRLHSQMDPGLVSEPGKVAGREAVAINPADAVRRGIADGDVVRVYNGCGACLAGAVVTDTVSPGVLRLWCGAWYNPPGDPSWSRVSMFTLPCTQRATPLDEDGVVGSAIRERR